MAKQMTSPATQSHTNQIFHQVGRFWHWWTGELLGMLPHGMKDRLQGKGRFLLAEIEEGRCSVRYGGRGNFKPITQLDLTDTWQVTGDGAHNFSDLNTKADETVLLLPPKLLLNRTLHLPAATESGLENVLKFEMDRHTPFTADQVYFGYRITHRDKKSEKLSVNLTLAVRAKVDPLLEQLESMGLRPTVMAPAADASEGLYSMNMLPSSDLQASGRKERSRRWMTLVLLALLFAVITLPVLQMENKVEVLRTEINVPKQQAMKAQAVADEVKLLKESRQFLVNKKTGTPSTLILLNELTQLLPDNTWISRMELRGNELKLQGESGQASALIGLLEGSGYLRNVRFSSPVTSNPRNQKERFVILALLRQEDAQ